MPSRTQPQDHQTSRKNPRKRTAAPKPETSQPIPQPQADPTGKYAPDAWMSGGVGGMEDFTVPSGQLCLVRRPGMEGLMKSGVLHNVDSLSQIVNEKHLKQGKTGKSTDEINVSSLMEDPEGLDQVMNVVDKVVCHCVVKPEIHRAPNDVTLRKPGVVYTDMVDLLDKMAIFQYVVGGTRDLESFRGGLEELVGGLEDGGGVQSPPE